MHQFSHASIVSTNSQEDSPCCILSRPCLKSEPPLSNLLPHRHQNHPQKAAFWRRDPSQLLDENFAAAKEQPEQENDEEHDDHILPPFVVDAGADLICYPLYPLCHHTPPFGLGPVVGAVVSSRPLIAPSMLSRFLRTRTLSRFDSSAPASGNSSSKSTARTVCVPPADAANVQVPS